MTMEWRTLMCVGVVIAVLPGCQATPANRIAGQFPLVIGCEGIELVLVPQGERIIGTNNSRGAPWERPAVNFRLDYVLYIGRTEVTAGQVRRVWPAVHVKPGYREKEPWVTDWETAAKVAEAFKERLEKATGRKWTCRLPREAEWEYAAMYGRPPGEDLWPWGTGSQYWKKEDPSDFVLDEYEWYGDNSGTFEPISGEVRDRTWHEVAGKKIYPLGVYDMLGNVSEWCDGWRTDSVVSMLEIGWKKEYPVIHCPWLESHASRGGCFLSTDEDCRPTHRPADSSCGFRIVALPRD